MKRLQFLSAQKKIQKNITFYFLDDIAISSN